MFDNKNQRSEKDLFTIKLNNNPISEHCIPSPTYALTLIEYIERLYFQ